MFQKSLKVKLKKKKKFQGKKLNSYNDWFKFVGGGEVD